MAKPKVDPKDYCIQRYQIGRHNVSDEPRPVLLSSFHLNTKPIPSPRRPVTAGSTGVDSSKRRNNSDLMSAIPFRSSSSESSSQPLLQPPPDPNLLLATSIQHCLNKSTQQSTTFRQFLQLEMKAKRRNQEKEDAVGHHHHHQGKEKEEGDLFFDHVNRNKLTEPKAPSFFTDALAVERGGRIEDAKQNVPQRALLPSEVYTGMVVKPCIAPFPPTAQRGEQPEEAGRKKKTTQFPVPPSTRKNTLGYVEKPSTLADETAAVLMKSRLLRTISPQAKVERAAEEEDHHPYTVCLDKNKKCDGMVGKNDNVLQLNPQRSSFSADEQKKPELDDRKKIVPKPQKKAAVQLWSFVAKEEEEKHHRPRQFSRPLFTGVENQHIIREKRQSINTIVEEEPSLGPLRDLVQCSLSQYINLKDVKEKIANPGRKDGVGKMETTACEEKEEKATREDSLEPRSNHDFLAGKLSGKALYHIEKQVQQSVEAHLEKAAKEYMQMSPTLLDIVEDEKEERGACVEPIHSFATTENDNHEKMTHKEHPNDDTKVVMRTATISPRAGRSSSVVFSSPSIHQVDLKEMETSPSPSHSVEGTTNDDGAMKYFTNPLSSLLFFRAAQAIFQEQKIQGNQESILRLHHREQFVKRVLDSFDGEEQEKMKNEEASEEFDLTDILPVKKPVIRSQPTDVQNKGSHHDEDDIISGNRIDKSSTNTASGQQQFEEGRASVSRGATDQKGYTQQHPKQVANAATVTTNPRLDDLVSLSCRERATLQNKFPKIYFRHLHHPYGLDHEDQSITIAYVQQAAAVQRELFIKMKLKLSDLFCFSPFHPSQLKHKDFDELLRKELMSSILKEGVQEEVS